MEIRYALFRPESQSDKGKWSGSEGAWYGIAANPEKFLKYFSNLPKGTIITEWGRRF